MAGSSSSQVASPTHSIATKGTGADAVGFEDLPGELRNEIYRLVLVSENPLIIARKLDRDAAAQNHTRHSAQYSGIKNDARIFSLYCTTKTRVGRQTRDVNFGNVYGPGLLRVSKSIYAEAVSILYGCNKFAFKGGASFDAFAKTARNVAPFLRSVEFQNSLPSTALFPFARNLISVSIRAPGGLTSLSLDFARAIDHLLGCESKTCRTDHLDTTSIGTKRVFLCTVCRVSGLLHARLEMFTIRTQDSEIHLKDALKDESFQVQDRRGDLRSALLRQAEKIFNGHRATMST